LYDIGGRVVVNKYGAKLLSVANGIFRRRTNAALAVFVVDPDGGEAIADSPASAEQLDFMRRAVPQLKEYLRTP
jgi:hypothetical protein